MRRWPLRWKLALYAAALAVIATLAGAATTWTIMRYWQLRAFDQRLALDAQELFRDAENFEGGGLTTSSGTFQEKFVPLALKDRLIEIRGPAGELLYLSPERPGPDVAGRDRKLSYAQDRRAQCSPGHVSWKRHDASCRAPT